MDNNSRLKEHRRSSEVEDILNELAGIINDKDQSVNSTAKGKEFPNIYILGCARSGSTVLYQALTSLLDVCFPTNLISRFYYAPFTGALIQRLFVDLDYGGELLGQSNYKNFSSVLGKTKGILSPNEFWYFWRSIFSVNSLGYINPSSVSEIDSFHNSLDAIKGVFGKPMVLKGMIANNCISDLFIKDRGDIIIHLEREVVYNAQSLLLARKEFYGNMSKWYSFGIGSSEFSSIFDEVVTQVIETNKLIESTLLNVPEENKMKIAYSDLGSLYNLLKTDSRFPDFKVDYHSMEFIKIDEQRRLNVTDWKKLNETYQEAID